MTARSKPPSHPDRADGETSNHPARIRPISVSASTSHSSDSWAGSKQPVGGVGTEVGPATIGSKRVRHHMAKNSECARIAVLRW